MSAQVPFSFACAPSCPRLVSWVEIRLAAVLADRGSTQSQSPPQLGSAERDQSPQWTSSALLTAPWSQIGLLFILAKLRLLLQL